MKQLPIPTFFDSANAGSWNHRPDHQALSEAANNWRSAHGLKPAGSDQHTIHLLGIDLQKDFCLPQGTLYVGGQSGTGAVDDASRFAQFLYRNMGVITETTMTLDTHFAFQIFFPVFWVDQDGNHPPPMVTQITVDDVEQGRWNPNPVVARQVCNGNYGWLSKQVLHYCRQLAETGKYTLTIWNPHCILGSDGHALTGVVQEARMFHAFARGASARCEIKGGHPLTENYSVLRPEVLTSHDGKTLGQRNVNFFKQLITSDMVVIGGQAASHCVASSIDDLLQMILSEDPTLARKVYILKDCMSSVVVPGVVDFTPQAEAALNRFADAGMHVVNSTDPIETWPGYQGA